MPDFSHNFWVSRVKIWQQLLYTFLSIRVLRFYTRSFTSFGTKLKVPHPFLLSCPKLTVFGPMILPSSMYVKETFTKSCHVKMRGPKLMNDMPHTPPPSKVCETPSFSKSLISIRNFIKCPSFTFENGDYCILCILALPFEKNAH